MEKRKEYLNEENYQRANKKVNKAGTFLLIAGFITIVIAILIAIYVFTSGDIESHILLFILITLPLIFVGSSLFMFGSMAKFAGHAREINAYMTQQQMPIAQEGIEKMAPSAGVAAKEIAKGIKEGLKDNEE